MPLEHIPDVLLPVADRRQAGQSLRKLVPRSLPADWTPPAGRRDPVQTLIETDRHRIAHLLPIRYNRMRASPLAFLRGSAAVMAADLAATPASGLWVQSCGDSHLGNFGSFASTDGTPVFDLSDFDETLPAPFEWDLKRLAASFAVAAKSHGQADKMGRQLARTVVLAYRTHMSDLMRLDPLEGWRSRIDIARVFGAIDEEKLRARELKRLAVLTEAQRRGYPKLIERRGGALRIRARPPFVVPLGTDPDDAHEVAARTAFNSYRLTLPEERRLLVERYRLADLAFKVVGVGSVGSFCVIALLVTADGGTLLLQIKEAQASVLAPYAGPSVFRNQGHRVVSGQLLMQAEPDMFLGWTEDQGEDLHCYVRQLKDQGVVAPGAALAPLALPHDAVLCGSALARAHARSGDAARIAGYMGSGGVFDAAVADFAVAYAEQTERDWRLFLAAIQAGRIEAHSP